MEHLEAEGETPGEIFAAPPASRRSATAGERSSCALIGGGAWSGPVGLPKSSVTPPSHSSPDKVAAPSPTSLTKVATGCPTCPSTTTWGHMGGRAPDGPSYARPVERHPAGVLCGPAGCGNGWRGVRPSFPLPIHSWVKGRSTLPPPPTICVWGGGRQPPAPHLGGGDTGATQYRQAGHLEPDPDEGPIVL